MRYLFLVLPLCLFGSCASTLHDLINPDTRPVTYNLLLTVRDGQLEPFRAVMADLVAATKQEPGTLVYEWYLADDDQTCHINERFHDTTAYATHSESFAKFADRFLACVEIVKFTVYGDPDARARTMLAALQPKYLTGIGGFRR